MINSKEYYVEVISEKLYSYYETGPYKTEKEFLSVIKKSVDHTIKWYKDFFEFDEFSDEDEDEGIDMEVFESDLLSDAKKALEEYEAKKDSRK